MLKSFLAVASLALCATLQAQTVLREIQGSSAGELLGRSIKPYFDFDSDGYEDYVVGRPGFVTTSAARGCVSVLSGKYVAIGAGPQYLASRTAAQVPTTGLVSDFGWSVEVIDSLDFDGKPDLVVSGRKHVGPDYVGMVWVLRSNATLDPASVWIEGAEANDWFGYALASCSDRNNDSRADVLVSAPWFDGAGTDRGATYLISGAIFMGWGGQVTLHTFDGLGDGGLCGYALSTDTDFDGDGRTEYVIACPRNNNLGGNPDSGVVRVYSGASYALDWIGMGANGERFGNALASIDDLDGDGVRELAIGAPYSDVGPTNGGRVAVYSGAHVAVTSTVQLREWTGLTSSSHFGAALCSAGDLNGDGKSDLLVGAPEYVPLINGNQNGALYAYSGETGELLGQYVGQADDHIGNTVAAGFDHDGDGAAEYVAASSVADQFGADSGVARVIRLFPETPASYCTSKTNSLGCAPAIGYSGSPSTASSAAFLVKATNVLNQKNGLLFYGFASNAAPFQGGFLCVRPPTHRTPVQSSGGNSSGNDCSGTFSFNFNALIQSHLDPALVLGQEVFTQYWSRDPQSASTTSLTNGLRFLINP